MLECNLGNIGATLSKFADEVRKKEKKPSVWIKSTSRFYISTYLTLNQSFHTHSYSCVRAFFGVAANIPAGGALIIAERVLTPFHLFILTII